MDIPRIDVFLKRGPGECNVCGGPLCVISSEITESILNSSGQPIDTKVIASKDIGYCTRCNLEYPNIHRRGIFFDVRGY